GALLLFWRKKIVRAVCLALGLLAGALCFLPGRAADPASLRAGYVASLQGYEGTLYVWGGETHLGIDCSGLVRCGLIEANLKRGIFTANPALIRQSFALWWHDCSARELGEGYRGKTRLILETPSLNALDHSRILPGDIAVTDSGVHTLA